jgi:radical SAM protein with 4Fe4S-binding SPASM domain
MDLLDRVAAPPRLSLMVRGERTLGYNPGVNVWHEIDDVQAEILRWLRAQRPKASLVRHIQVRFDVQAQAADALVQRALRQLIVRQLLDVDETVAAPVKLPENPLEAVYWIATQACNLRCTYCYQEAACARPNELSTAEACDLVDQVVEAGASTFVITGGEPFARRDVLQVAERARSAGLAVNVISNGHYIKAANARKVAESFDRITISLDHSRPEHHDRHRGAGSWAKSKAAIELLLNAGGCVDINSTLSKRASEDLPGLLSLREDRRIGTHRVTPQFPMGRAADSGNDPLDPDHLLALDDRMHAAQVAMAGESGAAPEPAHPARSKGLRRIHCGAGLSEVSVDPEGWVFPCRLLQYHRHRGDNVRDMRLADIVARNANIATVRNATTDRDVKCSTCVIRENCGGGCKGIHASFTADAFQKDALFCGHLRRAFEVQAWSTTGDVPPPRRVEFDKVISE